MTIILEADVGSTMLGLATAHSDRDIMRLVVEPPEQALQPFAANLKSIRNRSIGEASRSGDVEITEVTLRRYLHLCASGNPSLLLLLWCNPYLTCNEIGEHLLLFKSLFVTKLLGKKYAGYLRRQLGCLKGECKRDKPRQYLVDQFGYDTKFAMHALRLGLQGVEIMTSANLTIPVTTVNKTLLMGVREGKFKLSETIELINESLARLESAIENNDLPDTCNLEKLADLSRDLHLTCWYSYGQLSWDRYFKPAKTVPFVKLNLQTKGHSNETNLLDSETLEGHGV